VPPAVWSQARIVVEENAKLLTFPFPVDEVWEEEDPEKMRELMTVQEPRRFLIYPMDGDAYFTRLTSAQFRLLSLFKQGHDISSAIENMQGETFKAEDLMVWMNHWIQIQVIADIDISVIGCD
jgi:hypothetical protein